MFGAGMLWFLDMLLAPRVCCGLGAGYPIYGANLRGEVIPAQSWCCPLQNEIAKYHLKATHVGRQRLGVPLPRAWGVV